MTQPSLVIHPTTQLHIDAVLRKLPHAVIVAGPVGVGVRMIAQHIARQHGSPALIIEPKKKGTDGKLVVDFNAGSMVIDDVRELHASTRTKRTQKNIYVFDFGDRTMTTQAQNAFLKLLEEPHDGIHFILATHKPGKLLPTVVSRSQMIPVLPVLQPQTDKLLDSIPGLDPIKRSRLQFIAKGKPAEMIRLQSDDAYYERRIKVMQDAKTMLNGSVYERLAVAHRYKDDRTGAIALLGDMSMQLTVVIKSTKDTSQVQKLERLMQGQDSLAANGNVRLHLARCVI